jgi:hypothetical protein
MADVLTLTGANLLSPAFLFFALGALAGLRPKPMD